MAPRSVSHPPVRRAVAVPLAAGTLLIGATALDAHDFWIIPDAFQVSADSAIHANGRSGTRFPAGSAVQPTRVAGARIVGAGSEIRVTDISVQGSSLRLAQKPASPGQVSDRGRPDAARVAIHAGQAAQVSQGRGRRA